MDPQVATPEVKPEGDTVKAAPSSNPPKKTKAATPKPKPATTKVKAKGETTKVAAKEPKAKAAKKVKKEVMKIKGAQLLKKGPGPAMVALAKKVRTDVETGHCHFRGCTKKSVTNRAKWCLAHKRAIRKAQLKANNAVWRKRVKRGEAGHHVVYDGRATMFTLQNKPLAEKIVLAGRATVTTKTQLEKAIQAVPLALKKEIKKAS